MALSMNRSVMERESTRFTADGHDLTLIRVETNRSWNVVNNLTGEVVGTVTTRDEMRFTPRLSGGAVLPWGRTLQGAVYAIGRYIR